MLLLWALLESSLLSVSMLVEPKILLMELVEGPGVFEGVELEVEAGFGFLGPPCWEGLLALMTGLLVI